MKLPGHLLWAAIAAAGAFCLGGIALNRGEHISSLWLVVAAACTYATAYRFYGKFIAARVMTLDDQRATPAERLRNGHDFEPTNKWIVLGHHFAAIAGPGPLVGPVLAAQFGYLPGTLWIVIGAVLGGAVQDYVILFASMRRDGKSLGKMAREEIGPFGGFAALVTVLLIMIVLHRTHLFLVDERFLSFDDKDSNYRMLRETLLQKLPIPQENIHPIPTERASLQISATEYEKELKKFFKVSKGQYPEFDLILLGIGEDGHTASLFCSNLSISCSVFLEF